MYKTDKDILRKLASEYMEIATLPIQGQKIELWKALNRCQMQRPMVVIDQLPMHELNADGELTCYAQDPLLRGIEASLRKTIYEWKYFPVDMVVEPIITIPLAVQESGFGVSAQGDFLQTDKNNDVVSHKYVNQFETEDDLGKIKESVVTHDKEKSKIWLDIATDVFAGIAPIRQAYNNGHYLGIWDQLTFFMSIEECYYAMLDRPEFLHKLLTKMTNTVISTIEQRNKLGLAGTSANTCHCSYIYTDEFLPNVNEPVGNTSKHAWGAGLAQLFSSVSPDMMEEFEFPYIRKMAEQFGLIYYGCCDRLDDRMDLVKTIPNVKKVSCSPWSDRNHFAEVIGSNLIMSNKPNPALLAGSSIDEDSIRKDLRHTIDAAKSHNVPLELILKDISTVNYQRERLTRWHEIAMEEVLR